VIVGARIDGDLVVGCALFAYAACRGASLPFASAQEGDMGLLDDQRAIVTGGGSVSGARRVSA
jgi:hypothetical protein